MKASHYKLVAIFVVLALLLGSCSKTRLFSDRIVAPYYFMEGLSLAQIDVKSFDGDSYPIIYTVVKLFSCSASDQPADKYMPSSRGKEARYYKKTIFFHKKNDNYSWMCIKHSPLETYPFENDMLPIEFEKNIWYAIFSLKGGLFPRDVFFKFDDRGNLN